MDDKMRAQGLRALQKAAVATEGAILELSDIRTAGCGSPEAVDSASAEAHNALTRLKEAHRVIREAHIVKAEREQGAPLPFAEGPEQTRPPKAKKKGRGKGAAAGDPDADGGEAAGAGS